MRERVFLVIGLVFLAASVTGPGVQASLVGPTDWWGGHPASSGHMSWWGGTEPDESWIDQAQEFTVAATEFAFEPREFTFRAGDQVNLTLMNLGSVPHDLVIPDLDIHLAARPGEQSTVGISLDVAGSFDILCTLPGHAGSGMTGVLSVMADS